MTPERIQIILAFFHWSAADLARKIHCSRQTVHNWVSGKHPVADVYRVQLEKLERRMIEKSKTLSK